MVIYKYSCYCKANYTRLTTRHQRKRIKEHITKSVDKFSFSEKKDSIPVKVLNASKRLFIKEHLFNNSTCANSFNLIRLKILKLSVMFFDLIKLEAICIF